MRNYTHIAGAVLFFLIITYLLNIKNPLIGIFLAGWISVMPNVIDRFFPTRSWGHSIIWLIPLTLIAIFNQVISIALITGFVTHLLLDSFTVYGVPALYPFNKSGFVCLNKKRRFKTGSNQDKALFIFLIFLVVPIVLFSTSLNVVPEGTMGPVFAADNQTNNTSTSQNNNIYLSFKLDDACNKNITFEKINENKTTIVVKDTK